jgi:hypothetical protein
MTITTIQRLTVSPPTTLFYKIAATQSKKDRGKHGSSYAFPKISLGKSGSFGAVGMESCFLNADIGFIRKSPETRWILSIFVVGQPG